VSGVSENPHNNRLQRTALRAAAEPERWASTPIHILWK